MLNCAPLLPSKPQSSDAPAAEISVSETRFRWNVEAEGPLKLLDRPYLLKKRRSSDIYSNYKRREAVFCWPSRVEMNNGKPEVVQPITKRVFVTEGHVYVTSWSPPSIL